MAAPEPTPEPIASPADDARALAIGATLIRQFEGCTLDPQPDTPPHWEIGYGCNYLADGSPVTRDTPPLADMAAADALLMAELKPLAAQVDDALIVWAPPHVRGALYSFTWNEGLAALRDSLLLRLTNAQAWQAGADQFPRWVYAGGRVLPGLARRRAVERACYLGTIVL